MLVLDLAGTFVFALSGAMAAATHRLDLFGVLTLSYRRGTPRRDHAGFDHRGDAAGSDQRLAVCRSLARRRRTHVSVCLADQPAAKPGADP